MKHTRSAYNPILTAVLIGTIGLSVACDEKWQAGSSWGQAVWAEDEGGIALVKTQFETRDGGNAPIYRNFRSQVYRSLLPNSERFAVGDAIDGRIESLTYQRATEYIVVEHEPTTSDVGDGVTETRYRVTRLGLDGQTRLLAEHIVRSNYRCNRFRYRHSSPKPLQVHPSADGTIIAIVKTTEECGVITVSAQFVDGRTGDVVGAEQSFDIPDQAIEGTRNGDVVEQAVNHVGSWSIDEVYLSAFQLTDGNGRLGPPVGLFNFDGIDISASTAIRLNRAPRPGPIAPARCFAIATRSAPVNPDGDLLRVNADNGDVSIDVGPSDLRCDSQP